MSQPFRVGAVDLSAAEFGLVVRTIEAAWKSERGRRSAFKSRCDVNAERFAGAMADELEQLLRKLGWKGPRRRAKP